jgi:uncharacterized protein YdeI (YjbR/CyaY-like superfamily)
VGVEDYERVHPESRAEWRRWLAEHHDTAPGVWLVSWRTATGRPAVGYDASVEEALCFGWIDSLAKTVDGERSRQLFTPRRPRSGWSTSNKERVRRLLAAGLIEPAGLAAIEAAKANGSWAKLDDVERLVVPDDLAAALGEARGAWEAYPRSVKRGVLEWIGSAKRPETRAKRVAETAAAAARGERPGRWRAR